MRPLKSQVKLQMWDCLLWIVPEVNLKQFPVANRKQNSDRPGDFICGN